MTMWCYGEHEGPVAVLTLNDRNDATLDRPGSQRRVPLACSPTAAPIRTCAAIVVTGAGTTFCPGADTDELQVYHGHP